MKKLSAVLFVFLFCLASAMGAKADAIVSGSTSSDVFGGSSCNSSGGPGSSWAIGCTDLTQPAAYSKITANAGATSGSVLVNMSSAEGQHGQPLSYETAGFDLSITGTYLLTGGTGNGIADLSFDLFTMGAGGGGAFSDCTVTLDGQSQSCMYDDGAPMGFYVPYNTPLSLSVQMDYAGYGEFGDGAYSGVNYNLGSLTSDLAPEPTTWLLLGTGLIPLVWWTRRSSGARA